MDLERFDTLTRQLARKESRRKAIKSLLVGAGGAGALAASDVSAARRIKPDCCPTSSPRLCGETCVDTNSDPANCGACGTVCSSIQTCAEGACTNLPLECSDAVDCPDEDTDCQTTTCIDGRCGFTYRPAGFPTTVQTLGDCKTTVCDGEGGTITQNDDADKFDSNNQCVIDYCSSGNPATLFSPTGSRCAQGRGSYCNGSGECVECVEPSDCPDRPNSTSHCGDAGVCSIECNFGYTSCDASTENGCEVHLLSDPEHCGSCTNRCGVPANGSATCVQGNCGITCNPGYVSNGDTCVPVDSTTTTMAPCETDPRVGASCDTGYPGVCQAGTLQCVDGELQCVAAILPGTQVEVCDGLDNDCDGQVDEDFNFQTDVNNCGRCDNVCRLDNASASCESGQCVIASCHPGFFDCDGMVSNGCETEQNQAACGSCDTVCGINETCVNGRCGSLTSCLTAADCGEEACKIWSCDNAQCIVSYAPGGSACTNGQGRASQCDNSGSCLPTAGCASATDCDDNNPCTDDACHPDGHCVNAVVDDGRDCSSGGEIMVCRGGACVVTACGDGVCDGGETCDNCPLDCGSCPG